jgi:cob(I)alamin adenosyltransferase
VYTKTGDDGTSSLYNGNRCPKDEAVFWALGDTDELNNSVRACPTCSDAPVCSPTPHRTHSPQTGCVHDASR